MKLDVTRVLKDLYGKDMIEAAKDEDGVITKKPMTIRAVLGNVLVTSVQSDQAPAKPEEHVERFMLALKVVQDDEVELDSKQIVNLKTWIAARYAPLITGQLCMILEGKLDAPGKAEKD